MIDSYLLPLQKRLLQPVAKLLAERRFQADHITLAGFAIGLAAVPLLAFGLYQGALAAILLNRLFDGLDGAVARMAGPTDRGAFVDIAFDFFFYAAIPLGFAIADPAANALAAAVLIAAFVGTGSSFLAFAVVAEKRGLTAADYPQKGIYYLGGLAEGAETIAVFVAMCVWPSIFPLIAYGFAAVCLVTTLIRWRQGWAAFSTKNTGADVTTSER
ncbi:MAG: CDP-alcohol phosphatidyltransferase family protein [Allorhizobium sp.]